MQAWLLGLINGVGNAFLIVASNVIWAHFFGRENLGEIASPAQALGIIASGWGAYPLGLAYELTGSYATVLYAFSVIQGILSLAMIFIPDPKLKETNELEYETVADTENVEMQGLLTSDNSDEYGSKINN